MEQLEAGRELDALIAEKVMGLPKAELGGPCPRCKQTTYLTLERAWCYTCHEWIYSPYPEFSTDIAAAWAVVEKLIEKKWRPYIQFIDAGEGMEWRVVLFGQSPDDTPVTLGNTAQLAISLAALKIVEVDYGTSRTETHN